MNRSKIMVLGFLLIFLGIQLNLVQTYTLSPNATRFWNENLAELPDVDLASVPVAANPYNTATYSQASYGSQPDYGTTQPQMLAPAVLSGPAQITPPEWLCWPFIFVGAASVFYGMVLRR